MATAIPLGRPLPNASRDRPGRQPEGGPARSGRPDPARRPYLVLLLAGLAVPSSSPRPRCALTAPFHPYRARIAPKRHASVWRYAFCGAFPGVAPAGRCPAPCLRGARTFLHRPNWPTAAVQPSDASGTIRQGPRAGKAGGGAVDGIETGGDRCRSPPVDRRSIMSDGRQAAFSAAGASAASGASIAGSGSRST